MLNGKTAKKYDTKIRTFALTLHFYSPRGYRYIRSVFNKNLPAISTIRKWYSVIDGKPGLSMETFAALKAMANEANQNGTEILACLIQDEIAIRKQEEFDEHNGEKTGLVNFGTSTVNSDGKTFAKEALVFLVSGVNESFKVPVAYFLIAGLKGHERAALLREVLLFVSKTGVKIIGLVFDGLVANLAMVRILGANIKANRPYIINPHSDDKILIFPDACHMLKLVRNCLARKGILFTGDGKTIEWRFFVALEAYQRENKINLGNKINKTHIQWEKNKMTVKIACQTLSNSVADSIDLLRNKGIEEFEGSEETTQFFRRINNVFDILNSMHETAIGFKRPICPENEHDYFNYFDETIEYIRNLKLSPRGSSILRTRSKTAFLGLTIDMKNFRSFYLDYVHTNILPYVLTFRFSQDHLELLFACIRQMVRFIVSI